MIVVTIGQNQITVTGHAGYAPRGQDIVCAAVSTLTQCLVRALDQLTPGRAASQLVIGEALIRLEYPSEDTQLLVDAYRVGIAALAEAYPDNVELVEALTTVKQGKNSPMHNDDKLLGGF